ncbi:MAG TPA: hypothetical protein VM689_22035 [Aliidongia sp.]|nr:hypothetical protein [Aliidongia sp.]
MSCQLTDPGTNAVTGTPNTPFSLLAAPAGGFSEQTLLLSFFSPLQTTGLDQLLLFSCDGRVSPSEQPLRDRLKSLLMAGLQPAELDACKAEGARLTEAEALEFIAGRLLSGQLSASRP